MYSAGIIDDEIVDQVPIALNPLLVSCRQPALAQVSFELSDSYQLSGCRISVAFWG
jgi:hypothetical protein